MRLIQHVAVLIICLWEEHGLIEAGSILKRDEFHGIPRSGVHRLPGYQPPDGGHLFAHMGVEVLGPHVVQVPHELSRAGFKGSGT